MRGDVPNQSMPVTLQAGSRLGEYKIVSELGRGGMGIVYLAHRIQDNAPVALKVLLPQIASSPTAIRRFFREIRASSSLQHPNIIRVYGVGQEQGMHYFAMQYISGTSLHNYIKREDVPLAAKLGILVKICHALHHAHGKKIIHRDIKPSNILIDDGGEPYLSDFGLAKFVEGVSTLTGSGNVVGTPYYVSPEQIKTGKSVDCRADVYSLGVMLYQILTNTLPFTGDTTLEIYGKIMLQEPRPLREIDANIPAILENICLKAMAKSVVWRYPSALALAQDVEKFLAGRDIHLWRLRLHNTIARHRRSLVWALTGMVASVLAIAGTAMWERHQQQALVAPVAESPIVKTRRMFDILLKTSLYRQAYEAARELRQQGVKPTFAMVDAAWGAGHYTEASEYLDGMPDNEHTRRSRDYYHGALCYQRGCQERQSELARAWFRKSSELLAAIVEAPATEGVSRHLWQTSFHGMDACATLGMAMFYAWYLEPGKSAPSQQVAPINDLLARGRCSLPSQEAMIEWAKGELSLAQSENKPDNARLAIGHFTRALQYFPRQAIFYQQRAQARYRAHEPFPLVEADSFKALAYAPRNFTPWQTLVTAFLSPREYTKTEDMPDIAYLKFLIVGLKNYSIWLATELPRPDLLHTTRAACCQKYAGASKMAMSAQDRNMFLHTWLNASTPFIRTLAMSALKNCQQEQSFLQQLQQRAQMETDPARQAAYRELQHQLEQAYAQQKWHGLVARMVQSHYFKKACDPFSANELGQILSTFADDESPQYTLVIKILAAQLLQELNTPDACAILHQGLQQSLSTAVCCALVLSEAGYREPHDILVKAADADSPILQTLALEHWPAQADVPPNASRLLQQNDLALRLSAARLLWCRQGNVEAGVALAQEFANPVPEYQAYAYRWFWDDATRSYQQDMARQYPQQYRQYIDALGNALTSQSESLREIAFMMAGFHPEIATSLKTRVVAGLHDTSMAVRFAAILTLVKMGELETLSPYFLAAETPFSSRLAVLHAMYWAPTNTASSGIDKFYLQDLLPKLDHFLQNWEPEFRFLLLSSLGFFHKTDPISKAAISAVLRKYIASPDPYQAYGALYGSMMLEHKGLIAPVVKGMDSRNDIFIKYVSAAAGSSLITACEPEKWSKWQQKIQSKPELRRGASYGVYFQWQRWGRLDYFWYEPDASRRLWQQINDKALLNRVSLHYLLLSPYSRCYSLDMQHLLELWKAGGKTVPESRFQSLRRWREHTKKLDRLPLSSEQMDLARGCWIKEALHRSYCLLETCFALWPAMQYRYEQAAVAEAAGEHRLAASLLESIVFWDQEREPDKFKACLDEKTMVFCTLSLARVYRFLQRYQQAWLVLEKVRQKNPHSAFLIEEEAMLHFRQQRYELAAKQFASLYLLRADALHALVYRGFCGLAQDHDKSQAETARYLFDQVIQNITEKKSQSQKMAAIYGKHMVRYHADAFLEEWELNRTLGLAHLGLARYFATRSDAARVAEHLLRGYALYHQLTVLPAPIQRYGLATDYKLGLNYRRLFSADSPFYRYELRQYAELAPFLDTPDLQCIPEKPDILYHE